MPLLKPKKGDIAAVIDMIIESYQELKGINSKNELLGCAELNGEENGIVFTSQFFERYDLDKSRLDNSKMLEACYGYHRDLTKAVS